MGLIERLESKEGLTAAESALADYILENLDSVYRMSLQDLAKASYVSKPSVIRLYRKVGCSNYREFSIALQLERITGHNEGEGVRYEDLLTGTESTGEVVGKLGEISKQIIDKCVTSVDMLKIDQITDALLSADKIYILSCGNDLQYPEAFADYVGKFRDRPIIIDPNEDPVRTDEMICEKDAVLIIIGNEKHESDELLKRIADSDAVKILLTTDNDTKESYPADYFVYSFPEGNDTIRTHAYVSQLSITMGLNIIYTCLYLKAQKIQSAA